MTPYTYSSHDLAVREASVATPPRPEIDRVALDGDGMLLPHHRTFQAIYNLFSKTYSTRWDEAVRHGLEDARAMKNDAHFRALLQERLLPLATWHWQIAPEKDPANPKQPYSEDKKQVAALLQAEIGGTKRFAQLRLSLGDAIWYGRQGVQVAYDPYEIAGVTRQVVRRWEPVQGDKLHWSWEHPPHWTVFINPTARKDFPPSETAVTDRTTILRLRRPDYRQRFIVHTHLIEDAPYEDVYAGGRAQGVGLRDFLFWSWWLRDEMLSWMVNLAEKAGTLGILMFKYPAGNADAKKQAEQNAKDVNNRNALAIPVQPGTHSDDYGVEVVALPTEGLKFLKEVTFDYFDRQGERLVVGQSMSAGADHEDGMGGTGRADFAKDTKGLILRFDALNQAETFTEDFVPVIQSLNHPEVKWRFHFEYKVPDPQAKDKLDAINTAASLPGKKLSYKAEEVRDLVGMSKPESGDETIGGDEIEAPAKPIPNEAA